MSTKNWKNTDFVVTFNLKLYNKQTNNGYVKDYIYICKANRRNGTIFLVVWADIKLCDTWNEMYYDRK